MKGHRMKIIDEGTDLAKKQFEERMQFLEEEKKRLQEEERRREITKREQEDIEEAKMIAEGIKISNEDAEERKEKMEEAEGQLKMNLRPRTRSTTSSSYKTEDEDDKDDDSGSDSENDWYPLKSPPTIRREDDNRTEEEITAEYLNEHYSSPGGNIIDPSSNEEPETENMDTAEIPRENIFSNDDIHIRRVPLKVYNQKGMNMTKTINTVLENNKGMNLERYFRNLMITMTRAEQGIDADKQNGKLDNSTKIAQARRYKAARLAAEHTWKGEDSEDYFNKRKEKAAQREREQKKKKTQKYRSSTPTDKTKENLNKTVDLVSPDRDAKREQKSKKRGHDDLDFDTDYCSDDDKVPSECDKDTKIVITKKNKKTRLTKKLLKGEEARSKNLRQELRDMREKCEKEKTLLNKTIADIETENRNREKDLAEKEINLTVREKKLDEKGNKLKTKKTHLVEAVVRKVSEKQKQSGVTDEESLRQSVDSEITSIMDDEEESVFLDQESGTGLTETSEMDEEKDLDYWDKQDAQIKNYDEPLDTNLLDDDNQEESWTERQTPEGQVNTNIIFKAQTHTLRLGRRERNGDSRHRVLRDRCLGRGLSNGGDRRPEGRSDLKKRKEVQSMYHKTEYFLLNYVQSRIKTHVIFTIFFLFVNKDILVKSRSKVNLDGLETLTKTYKEVRKKIRNRLLLRAANRVEKKTWREQSERQDNLLTCKRSRSVES